MGKDSAIRVAIRCVIVEEITNSLTDAELSEFDLCVQLEADPTKYSWYKKAESFYATQDVRHELTKEAVGIVWQRRKARKSLQQQSKN